MLFLGTGGAELVPNPYCECDVCRFARASADARERRARSSFFIDSGNLIDCGPDTTYAADRYGCSLSGLKNLFMTHLHSDHFDITSLEAMIMSVTEPPHLQVYLSEEAYHGLQLLAKAAESLPLNALERHKKRYPELLTFHPIHPFDSFVTDDGMHVTALKTNHPGCYQGEYSLNYLFERNGKRFLYACDTGRYAEENFEQLKDMKLDYLILEGSFGLRDVPADFKHMSCDGIEWMVSRFIENGNLTQDTAFYITHISHKAMLTHFAYEKEMRRRCGDFVNIAYDGLEIGSF